jgi:hypothetical protein
MISFFQIHSNSSFTYHLTSQCYTAVLLSGLQNKPSLKTNTKTNGGTGNEGACHAQQDVLWH